MQRWYRILSEALRKYLRGRQLIPPATSLELRTEALLRALLAEAGLSARIVGRAGAIVEAERA